MAEIDRRQALKRLGVGALGLALGGCAVPGWRPDGFWTPGIGRGPFAPVRVSRDRILRTVVGLRPYRPGGFVVDTERFDETLVVHNYGHGGGGMTLSWGTSELAVGRVLATEDREVAVLGCGAVGLATARLLQRAGRRVTIYARDLPPNTTSNVAGAQFTPYSVFDEEEASPVFRRQFLEATRLSHRRFQDYLGPEYGVRVVDNYYAREEPWEPSDWMRELDDVFSDIAPLPPGTHPFGRRHVTRVATLFIEPTPYLRALMEDVRQAGAEVHVRNFRSLDQVLELPERVVINCTGLGARALFGDDELVPIKGQLTVLRPQPEVDYLLLAGGLYMFPRRDGILLGGTFERGHWSLTPNRRAIERVVKGHRRLFGMAEGV